MAVLFQNVAKFINSPFPETRNHLCRVQHGGRAESFIRGLALSPGPGPRELWCRMGPPPLPVPQFPHLQSKETGLQISPYVLPKSGHMPFTAYKGQLCNRGPQCRCWGLGCSLSCNDVLFSFLFFFLLDFFKLKKLPKDSTFHCEVTGAPSSPPFPLSSPGVLAVGSPGRCEWGCQDGFFVYMSIHVQTDFISLIL